MSTVDGYGPPALEKGVQQSQVASETFNDNSPPILIMSPALRNHMVCFGDEDGTVELFDYVTSEQISIGQTATQRSIEHLVWSEQENRLCYGERGGRLTIEQVEQQRDKLRARRAEKFRPNFNSGNITQILFLPESILLVLCIGRFNVDRDYIRVRQRRCYFT